MGGGWWGGIGRRGIVITGLWDCLQRTNNNQLFRAWFSVFPAPTDNHPLIHSNIIILAFFHPRSVLSSPLILIMQGRELIFNYLLPSIIHQLFFYKHVSKQEYKHWSLTQNLSLSVAQIRILSVVTHIQS